MTFWRFVPRIRGLLMGVYTLLLVFVAVSGQLVEPTGRWYMWVARVLWGRHVLALGGVRLKVSGLDNLRGDPPFIVCANHASQLDIPAIFGALPFPVRFLAKRSLFYIPVFGWSMWLARFIPVDRGGGKRSRKSLENAAKRLKGGSSLMVFPEGTRSSDGRVGKFKAGAFVLAQESGLPILPVAIRGSYQLFPKKSLRHRSGVIEVRIGLPVHCTEDGPAARDALKKRVKDQIENMLI